MPSNRTLGLGVGALGAAVAFVVAAYLVTRDDAPPATGELIAYSCKEPKNPWYAICVIGTDGAAGERLTSQLATTDPAWSPDGRKIAFTRNEEVGEFTTFTADDVFVMNADGSDVERLTPDEDGMSSSQPVWSPDGGKIAYVRGQSRASTAAAATALQFGELLVTNPDGSDTRRLTQGAPDGAPAWSPDGREVVFVRGHELNQPSSDMDLWVVDATGGVPRRLTSTPDTSETAPAWSPDGRWIAFMRAGDTASYDGNVALFVIRRDGTDERRVLDYQYYAYTSYGLAWSPDGGSIAFETSPSLLCTAISIVDVERSDVRPLTSCTKPRESSVAPVWQPDTTAE